MDVLAKGYVIARCRRRLVGFDEVAVDVGSRSSTCDGRETRERERGALLA
jgi:hypothetical protein